MNKEIPFYVPFIAPGSKEMLNCALTNSNSLFKGEYAGRCRGYILEKYECKEVVLTSSCTDALIMASIILDLQAGDEVIMPAYTFISVANAFANRGITIKLVDSQPSNPNIDPEKVKSAITEKSRAVVFMSYSGQAEGIEEIKNICEQNSLWLIEDAAHSFNSEHNGKLIGTYGDVAAFSFHETKTVHCGQGGMLLINKVSLVNKAKSVQTHGSNKSDFELGLVPEYNWISLGSEYNLSELNAAFLYKQLEYEVITKELRRNLWNQYYAKLAEINQNRFKLPVLNFNQSNHYIFYILLESKDQRNQLMAFLKKYNIHTAFHYTGLNRSEYYNSHYGELSLENSDMFSECLLRLPLYPDLNTKLVDRISSAIALFYSKHYYETMV
jgi:dTDP-4-amino-4,6-dideoxygalactose transaminase